MKQAIMSRGSLRYGISSPVQVHVRFYESILYIYIFDITHRLIGSMFMIYLYTYIWVILRANVDKYSVHGAYGLCATCCWLNGVYLLRCLFLIFDPTIEILWRITRAHVVISINFVALGKKFEEKTSYNSWSY